MGLFMADATCRYLVVCNKCVTSSDTNEQPVYAHEVDGFIFRTVHHHVFDVTTCLSGFATFLLLIAVLSSIIACIRLKASTFPYIYIQHSIQPRPISSRGFKLSCCNEETTLSTHAPVASEPLQKSPSSSSPGDIRVPLTIDQL